MLLESRKRGRSRDAEGTRPRGMSAVSSPSPRSLPDALSCACRRDSGACVQNTGGSSPPLRAPPALPRQVPGRGRCSRGRVGESTVGQHLCLALEGDTQREGRPGPRLRIRTQVPSKGKGGAGPGGGGRALRRADGGVAAWGSSAGASLLVSPCDKRPTREGLCEGLCWADGGSSEKASPRIVVFQEPSAQMCQSRTFGVVCPTVMGGTVCFPSVQGLGASYRASVSDGHLP